MPAAQFEHDKEPLDGENVPPGHEPHALGVLSVPEDVPGGHSVQAFAPAEEKEPAGHCWQAICKCVGGAGVCMLVCACVRALVPVCVCVCSCARLYVCECVRVPESMQVIA